MQIITSRISNKRANTYRRIIKYFCSLFFLLALFNIQVTAQDSLKVIRGENSSNNWLEFTDSPHILYHYLAGEAYNLLDDRSEKIMGLQTLSDWQHRQKKVQKSLLNAVGPFPLKTPLNPRLTKKITKDWYQIENIVYESQPDFYVTSSLFIPKDVALPAPAVIYASGHIENYKDSTYQHFILNLVKKGFVVFAFDPVSLGERIQYYDPKTKKSSVGRGTSEHLYSGAQALITGNSQAKYMIWDGIRAVDYLLSRKEVDPDRIGIIGSSGGGTQSAYISAMDKRIYAMATSNYITSFTRLLQSIGPQDAEQILPDQIAHGIDHADFLEVRAPKPTLMLTNTNDFFSIQGARETASEVSSIYEVYGETDYFDMVNDVGKHSFTKKKREAVYAFFQQQLDNLGSPVEEEVVPLDHKKIRVTRTGQVTSSLGGETIFSLNCKQARKEQKVLQTARKNLDQHLPKARKAAKKLSGYMKPDSISNPVFTGRIHRDEYVIEKYFMMGENSAYPIPYLLFVPDNPNGKAVIYLNPSGKATQAAPDDQMAQLAKLGITVMAPDMIGIGETAPNPKHSYGLRTEWDVSVIIGRSIVGIQAGDIIRLTRWMKKRPKIEEVSGLAHRQMGPVLLHAAAFDSSLARVALIKPYSSYRSIVMNRFYEPEFIPSTVAGALQAYDLPDLAASLAPRKLLIAGMRDGTGAPADSATMRKDTSVIKAAYEHKSAGNHLKIVSSDSVNLRKWVK